MPQELYLLDTFSSQLFQGNPSPVCLLEREIPEENLRQLAMELSMPVMAFVYPPEANQSYPIRYFTRTGEIPACGHATLGAAEVLAQVKGQRDIIFQTKEGVQITARREGKRNFISYPKYFPQDYPFPHALLEQLGKPKLLNHFYSSALETLFLEFAEAKAVREIQPDYQKIMALVPEIKELVIMAKSPEVDKDVILRSFCPWIGIDEDPVTGSIHSVLGPYWEEKLLKKSLRVYQASERGGDLWVQSFADRVEIGGECVLYMKGILEM
ncbi:MAG: PhzF family phenazine biosynthesis protein [Bacteroidota bacterium]